MIHYSPRMTPLSNPSGVKLHFNHFLVVDVLSQPVIVLFIGLTLGLCPSICCYQNRCFLRNKQIYDRCVICIGDTARCNLMLVKGELENGLYFFNVPFSFRNLYLKKRCIIDAKNSQNHNFVPKH